jgi:glutathionylspermidine synthase
LYKSVRRGRNLAGESTLLSSYAPHELLELPTEDIEQRLDQILVSRSHGPGLIQRLRHRVDTARIYFGGRPLPTFPKPHLIAGEDEQRWAGGAERLMSSFEVAGRMLLADPDLRGGLGLPAGSDELLAIDPGYSRLIVVSRFDMVWSGRQARVLELNADSPAMMTFTDRVEGILLELEPVSDLLLAQGARPRARTRALHDALVATYAEWGGSRVDPTIAIVDWQGEATASELQHTAADFERFGSPTVVCDPRELYLVDGWLHAQGRRIDVVQRRVLFPDFIRRADDLSTLLTAYKSGKVCMVNPLRSYVVGNKVALAMMSLNVFNGTPAERAVTADLVPPTEIVEPGSIDRLQREKDGWVLKGAFSSGGKEVTIGRHVTPAEWRELLERAARSPSVVQRLEPIPRYRVPIETPSGDLEMTDLYANWNPWFFNGRYGGATTRVGWKPVVVISGGGGLLASMTSRVRTRGC